MNKITFLILSVFILSSNTILCAADENAASKRFYAGEILRAEVQPDNASMPITVSNVSPHEPKSTITTDVGYALVTVKLDDGRSLGMYDYSLVNSGKRVFPCIALVDGADDYDGSKWEIKKTRTNKKYTMLFKVQLPPNGPPEYDLRFNLMKNMNDIPLPFINVKAQPFTDYKKIPMEGMLGVDPYKVETSETPEKSEAKKPKKPKAKPKVKPEGKASRKEKKRKADQAAWDAIMGDAGQKKEEPKKKEEKKATPPTPKKAKDAWDDWN